MIFNFSSTPSTKRASACLSIGCRRIFRGTTGRWRELLTMAKDLASRPRDGINRHTQVQFLTYAGSLLDAAGEREDLDEGVVLDRIVGGVAAADAVACHVRRAGVVVGIRARRLARHDQRSLGSRYG